MSSVGLLLGLEVGSCIVLDAKVLYGISSELFLVLFFRKTMQWVVALVIEMEFFSSSSRS